MKKKKTYPYLAINENQMVNVIRPIQSMGDMLLCVNKAGQEWYIPVKGLVLKEGVK